MIKKSDYMIQDMGNKIMKRIIANLTPSLTPCDKNTRYGFKKQVNWVMAGCRHTLFILMSMLRVRLEYTYSMPRICLQCACTILLLLPLGSGSVWGQPGEGLYYIANYNNNVYDSGTPANNYYLVPAANPQQNHQIDAYYSANYGSEDGDSNQPFLTTYKTNKIANSVWRIEASGESGYYYIIHQSTGRYIIYEPVFSGSDSRRKSMHLKTTDTPDDKAKFEITTSLTGYAIRPKLVDSGHRFFNVASANSDNYYGTGSPGFYNGLVGLYSDPSDKNGVWIFEKATIDPPTITNNYDGTFTISATSGATIYYTTDGTTPTTLTTTTGTTSVTFDQTGSMTVIKAIAKGSGDYFASGVTTYNIPQCAKPVITISGGNVTITCATEGAAIYYTTDGSPATSSSAAYTVPFAKGSATTFRAIATKAGYVISSETILLPPTEVSSSSEITDMSGNYILATGFSASGSIGTSTNPFTGTIDGGLNPLTLSYPLVAYADGATIKNVILDNVNISGSTNVGAVCNEATGATRIYNCGVLASNSTVEKDDDGYDKITSCSSTISGSGYVGGIVGLLDGSSRVINCFSYANVSGGSEVGGIVGHNNVATTANNLKTMVMNCMFYGEVSGSSIAPIYNGEIITNDGDENGVNNFNYFRLEASYIRNTAITKVYNCALGAETRFLQRFEFFRYLLNSNRELAAWWATGDADNKDEIMKWVMEPSQIGTAIPYPILKSPGRYASVVNYTPDETPYDEENRNKGRKLGTLAVTIQNGTGGAADASITNSSLSLTITDKDFEHFNFNYGKVQLPYYNDVGTKNYTDGKVVTGWKIVSITGGTPGSYSTGGDVTYDDDGKLTATPYNFADRKCTKKDLYGTGGSNRVFNQGAYWDVPEGVTAITIQPYWGKAVYLADAYWDVVYKNGTGNDIYKPGSTVDAMTTAANVPNVGGGQHYNNGVSKFNDQLVYTSMTNAVTALSPSTSGTVYDYAVVLVGNYHEYSGNAQDLSRSGKPYTITSIDNDGDNEPDYSFMWRFDGRTRLHPVRYDFLNLIGLGMAQKSTGGTGSYNFGIPQPIYWFEVTNTALFRVTQMEYSRNEGASKRPIILQGGVIEQWVTLQSTPGDRVSYFHVGGNVWFKEFHRGSHQDNKDIQTPHPPVSVTGGDFNKFYLTGLYQSQAGIYDDNAECYVNGGRFGEVAGAGMEGIGTSDGKGNITWVIDHADMKEFYGGGINFDKPVHGNIHTIISNSHVNIFCGGPKFGDMETDRTVTTTATNCTFGTYFGAGFGGNSYNRYAPTNRNNVINLPGKGKVNNVLKDLNSWNEWVAAEYTRSYNSTYNGVSTQIDYQFIPMSSNTDNVARLFVDFVGFSLATTRNVTSSLTGCTITGNFYGGGSLGKVEGNVTSTLTNCKVDGSVFGAGYSASLPTVEVMNTGGFPTEPYYYTDLGTYRTAVLPATTTYTWEHATPEEFNNKKVDNTNHILYTTADLTTLGAVTGNVILTIDGNTVADEDGKVMTVAKSVYGGGEESDVLGNTKVTMTGGYVFNGIFGGGYSGSVGTITARDPHNYDGTEHDTTHEGCVGGKPTAFKENTGKCTVVVTGGQIGPIEVATLGMKRPKEAGGPVPEGWVWGGGCGIVADPATDPDTDFRTYVKETDVTIRGNAFILESIIGGGEFGRVLGDTHVTIEGNCQIGVGYKQTNGGSPKRYTNEQWTAAANAVASGDASAIATAAAAMPECSHFDYGKVVDGKTVYETFDPYYDKYYDKTNGIYKDNIPSGFAHGSTSNPTDGKTWIGCVFGGGSGYMPYEKSDGTGYGWIRSAGLVEGNTLVEIKGGHILTNVYGGNEVTDVKGKCRVEMTGGTIGVPRTLDQIKANPFNGNLYGAGKGDPRTYFNEFTNVGSVEVDVSGGIIYGSVYGGGEDGHVTGNVTTTIKKGTGDAPIIGCDGTSGDDGNVFGAGQGSTVSLTSGVVSGNVTLNIQEGNIKGSVYGGGQIGSVGTHIVSVDNENYGKMKEGDDHGCLTVNLTGGTIEQNIYGGCMGTTEDVAFGISKNVIVELNNYPENEIDAARGCAVVGSIFGCNNVNSSPEGTVSVHIYGTQHVGKSQIANSGDVTDAKTKGIYDVTAVYGGGNMAAYTPKNLETGTTNVIIDGCGLTSIRQVYGGGNAASTPATSVTVNGTFEIEEVFGGGNGLDDVVKDGVTKPNPGANVGYKDYSVYYQEDDVWKVKDNPDYDTKDKRINSDIRYGSGKASVNIFGGTVHRVFGGSNTKGNVRQTAVTMLEEAGGCDFCVDEAYGGGKSAPMDAEAKLLMACIPGLSAAYGGAEAADIQGNVTLNITNGTFDRVFGGNNLSGTISGSITVNIEEVGCKPIIIGELYGGGNQAGYSVKGYDSNKQPKETGDDIYDQPQVNVKSFTSIGNIYGGGYGTGAVMVGNPTVNINEVVGTPTTYPTTGDDYTSTGFKGKTITVDGHDVILPSHTKNKIGAINNVFGGGNAAEVKGSTTVNIGTLAEVYLVKEVAANADVSTYYTRDNDGTYTAATGTAQEDTTYYEKKTVIGADIRGNVYGGGNEAEVTGNTNVTIGKQQQ